MSAVVCLFVRSMGLGSPLQNGRVLEYASKELKADREVVFAAVPPTPLPHVSALRYPQPHRTHKQIHNG